MMQSSPPPEGYVVHLDIDESFEQMVDSAPLEAAVRATLAAESVEPPTEVSLVITGDDEIQELNRDYRGLDTPTDVLSFGFNPEDGFVVPPGGARQLGDIIIAYPYTERSAARQGHSVARELLVLTVHGTLHILGYDDEEEEANLIMLARQNAILATLPA